VWTKQKAIPGHVECSAVQDKLTAWRCRDLPLGLHLRLHLRLHQAAQPAVDGRQERRDAHLTAVAKSNELLSATRPMRRTMDSVPCACIAITGSQPSTICWHAGTRILPWARALAISTNPRSTRGWRLLLMIKHCHHHMPQPAGAAVPLVMQHAQLQRPSCPYRSTHTRTNQPWHCQALRSSMVFAICPSPRPESSPPSLSLAGETPLH
jgi:hypothetical protein